jgi:YidC/Oxa1 family membrane protein insertase
MSLGALYQLLIYQPILNALIWLYIYLPGKDLVWAVIVLSLIIKFIFYPISIKAVKTQEAMNKINPEMKEIRKKYKDDPAEQSKMIMGLYKKHEISPWSGMIYPLIQFPILIAIFQILRDFSSLALNGNFYSFIPFFNAAEMTFLGNPDLTQPNIILAILVALAQYWQQKTSGPAEKTGWQKNMLYLLPAFIFFMLTRLSAVLGLYWLINTLFSVGQQYYLKRKESCSSPPKQKK